MPETDLSQYIRLADKCEAVSWINMVTGEVTEQLRII